MSLYIAENMYVWLCIVHECGTNKHMQKYDVKEHDSGTSVHVHAIFEC